MEENGPYTWNKMASIHGTKLPLYMEQNGPYKWKKCPLYMEKSGPYTWNKMASIHGTKWPLYMEQNGLYTWDTMAPIHGAGRFSKIKLLFLTFNI